MITSKTRMISVYKFIEQLPKTKRENYLKQLELIEKEIEEIE